MPVVLPTFEASTPQSVRKVLTDLVNAANALQGHVEQAQAVAARAARFGGGATPVLIEQVRRALSATGSDPLDLTSSLGTGLTQLTGEVLAGPGTGSVPASLSTTGVVPGSYGGPHAIPVLAVDSKGRIVAITAVGIDAGVEAAGYWSPLTNGDATTPELIFADGDTISVWTPTP